MESLYLDIIIKNWTYKQETAFMCAVPCMVSKAEDDRIYFSPLFFPLAQNWFRRQMHCFVNPLIRQLKNNNNNTKKFLSIAIKKSGI